MKIKNSILTMSVCMPVYKGSTVLQFTLESVLKQSFKPLEIIVCDDNKLEALKEIRRTKEILKQVQDDKKNKNIKIRYIKNKTNLGSAKTIKNLAQLARGEIVFYLCQDDILARDALQKTHDAFLLDTNIGVVTRPFFWFEEDMQKPIRAVFPYDSRKDSTLSVSDEGEFKKIFESVGQISGLAYRKKYLTVPFTDDIFVGHIYPFAGILRKHSCVFLKDFTVAVGSSLSQSRHKSSIYDISPTEQWVSMFKKVFPEGKYRKVREAGIAQISSHAEGLMQIKNYAKHGLLKKEMGIMIKYHWRNLVSPKFWFYTMVCFFIPSNLLIKVIHLYKKYILGRGIETQIRFIQ